MIYVISHYANHIRTIVTATTSMKKAVDKTNSMFEDEDCSDMQFAEIFSFKDSGETYDVATLSRREFNCGTRFTEGKNYITFEQEVSL